MLKKLRRIAKWDAPTVTRIMTLWYCADDSRAGVVSRAVARLAVLYAYSPIDLIPDFIPFIGHLDDLLLLPIAARLVQRWVPAAVWTDASLRAQQWVLERGTSAKPRGVRMALWGFVIALVLLIAGGLFGVWVLYQVLTLPKE